MKNMTRLFAGGLLAMTTLTGASVARAWSSTDSVITEQRLQGVWTVVARVCETSGSPARDAFVLGRDRMEIHVNGTNVEGFGQIEDKMPVISSGGFDIEGGYVAMRLVSGPSSRQIEKMRFDLTDYPTLIVTSTGFGERGSCASGESLKTYFRKVETRLP